MLSRLTLLNFKPFKNQELELAPLTLLAGLNNSGKSSVIQAIRMFWNWDKTGDPTLPGHGPLKELKNKNAREYEQIAIRCLFASSLPDNPDTDMGIHIAFVKDETQLLFNKDNKKIPLPIMSYIGADRWGPHVLLPLSTAANNLTDVGSQGEYVIDYFERHDRDEIPPILHHPEAEGITLEYNTRAWLTEIAPHISFQYGIERKRDTSFTTFNDFRPTNSGFGLSYTLPIIVQLLGMAATCHNNGIVLIENPEAHLHPKGQTTMGEFLARAAQSGVQVIVETHSDYIMDGIRIAVKKKLLEHSKTRFYYFESDKEYATIVKAPKIDKQGKLDFWPEGFFDQTMKNRAILARRD